MNTHDNTSDYSSSEGIVDDGTNLHVQEVATNTTPKNDSLSDYPPSEDMIDDGTNFHVEDDVVHVEPKNETPDGGSNEVPGFAGMLGLKTVCAPSVGSAEYDGCRLLVDQIWRAITKARNAPTVQLRFQTVGRMATSLVDRLDGRHAGLPLIVGDGNDPLYQLAQAARKVVNCLAFKKRNYRSVSGARQIIASVVWETPTPADGADIRKDALQLFHELTILLIAEPSQRGRDDVH